MRKRAFRVVGYGLAAGYLAAAAALLFLIVLAEHP